jgi:hypothetical protein
MLHRVNGAQVRDAITGELNRDLVGQPIQIVIRDTTTLFPIQDNAGDPIPGSELVVMPTFEIPWFWIDTTTPADLYLDWLHAASGARGPVDFDAVLRDAARGAQVAAEQALAEVQAYIAANPGGGSPGVTVHNQLSGLTDGDPHTQYLTPARAGALHPTFEQVGTTVANAVSTSSAADRDRTNHYGEQAISTITNLESRLQAAANSGGSPIVQLPDDGQPPLGVAAGSIIARIPTSTVPTTTVETVAYSSQGTTVTCPVPTDRAVGDVMIFIPAFDGASTDIVCSDTGWSEILDYSGSQGRKGAAYVYRIADAAALAALGSNVTATVATAGRRMGVCFKLSGARAETAWPAYGSGSNRSAATLTGTTTTGWTVPSFSTATVPFSRVALFTIHDGQPDPATAAGFTEVGHVSCSDAGAEPKTLTVLIKSLAATPVPAATVVHPASSTTASGGGQFIIPVAP